MADALAADPGERFDVVLTNPPFGKKSSTMIVGEDGKVSTEKDIIERDDFWATTRNKQLNFVQHIKTLLKINGRARGRGARQRALRGRRRRDDPPQAAARMRRAHPAAPADRHLLRPGREGQRALLRHEAGQRNPVDQEALDLRPAHQQAFHAEDQARCSASDLDEFVGLLQPGQPPRAQAHLVAPRTPTAAGAPTSYDELSPATRPASTSSG